MFAQIENNQGAGSGNAERAILVRQMERNGSGPENQCSELRELALSAGAQVCTQLLAVRARPVAATYLGRGKIEELAGLVRIHDATVIIFDHDISPVQERNIERMVECRVLDRTGLILDIFAQRATSSEGKLQVELAQLTHLSTRLVRGWTHLERQKGGIGLRGPGESQLETDRRLVGQRIKTLTRRLRKVESQRALRRRARLRTPIPTVSLVGYTNAGKSSLFNTLTKSNVLVADKLFATLDPTMRRLDVPGFGPVVLSDTVGFIQGLPHSLIAAFHATLEEVTSASCLLLVSDLSNSGHKELQCHVQQVLEEIGAGEIPVLHVYNKIDLTGDRARLKSDGRERADRVWLSACTGDGVDLLTRALGDVLGREHVHCQVRLQPQAGELRSRLYQRCEILEENTEECGAIVMKLKTDPATLGWLQSQSRFDGLWRDVTPGTG